MSPVELRKLPTNEKWGYLAADENATASPEWHKAELKATETDFAAGKLEVLDWSAAKEELRRRFK